MSNDNVCRPKYSLMNEEQIKQIHNATLKVLESVGVKVSNAEARQLLTEAGCILEENEIVKIPSKLVEECIKSVPSSIIIYDRNGKEAMHLEERNNYFGLGTDLINTVDLQTRKTRPSVLNDVKNAAIVSDYCSNVDFVASFALPHEVSTNLMYIECAKMEMESTTKPIFFTAAGSEDLEIIIQMAETIVGGENALKEKPFIIHYSEPTAPLMHSAGAIKKLFLCAEKNIPICYVPGVLMGASGPVSLAGGIVQANAESLSGIVLHQLKNKGAPIISGWAVVPLDMKEATYCYGSPELRITNTAFADIYHWYKIPMWSIVGTDSHTLDEQAAFEHTFSNFMAALDGANLIHDIGYLGQGLLGDPVSIVMCDEIISYIKRIMRGFEINEETLALDIITKVGPGGDFFKQRHTLKHFRKEHWFPILSNRKNPEGWEKSGGKSYKEKAIEKTREILNTHKPEQLHDEISSKLNEILGHAKIKLKDKKFSA